jgi:hypothetical protein
MATIRGLYAAYSTSTPKYRSITYKSSFNHTFNNYHNKFDTATFLGLNVKLISILLIYFNTIVYSTFYEFYSIGLKITEFGRNMLPE